ncbi:O-antigen ligase family protein [Uliginosibacterium sp. sgz301328]|uniref:O-antigen ligase family protein n=1 Tax=Uliginosibacterium sp. sgz301328 TaxID=3243764 RepID=UPI00359D4D1A
MTDTQTASTFKGKLLATLGGLMALQIVLAHISRTQGGHLTSGVLILLCVLAIVFVDRRGERQLPTVPPAIWIPLLAWAGFATLSIAWSMRPSATLNNLASDLWMPVACFYGAFLLGNAGRTRAPVWGALIGLALILLTSLATIAMVGPETLARGLPPELRNAAVVKWFPGPGKASTMIITMLPLLVWAIRARVISRPVGSVALVVALLCGAATQNRMFWVCLLTLGACALLFRVHRRGVRRAVTPRALLGAFGFVALCAVMFVVLLNLRAPATVQATGSAVDVTGAVSAVQQDPRQVIWSYWIDMGKKSPWIGTGFGKRAASVANDPSHPLYQRTRDNLGWHPHNVFLSMWVQLGWAGLTLFVLFVGGMLYHSIVIAQPGSRDRIAGMAFFMLIAALMAKNLTDDFYDRELANTFFSYTGLLIGAAAWPPGRRKDSAADAAG